MYVPLFVWIVLGVIIYVVCYAAVYGVMHFRDDLPFNPFVRGVLLLLAPITVTVGIIIAVGGFLVSGFWESVKK